MPTFRPEVLHRLTSSVFEAAGAPPSTAALVASSLIESELAGHESHGVIRIPEYLEHIRLGHLDPRAEPEVLLHTGTLIKVDGHRGFGQRVADWTMSRLIEMGAKSGIAAGAIRGCGHMGRVGPYVEKPARSGLIGIGFVNGGGKEPRVAPHGGREALFGTNPFAAAIPTGGDSPIVVDFSTAVAASGRIRVAREKGELLPVGWVLDRQGMPSRNAEDYYSGGMLLPAAGPKGYGLSMLIECLAGFLTGAGSPGIPRTGYELGNGALFIVLKPESFGRRTEFLAAVGAMEREVRSCPPVAGESEVMLPGEPEARMRIRRMREGIPIPERVWAKVVDSARRVGVGEELISESGTCRVQAGAMPPDDRDDRPRL